MKLRPVDVPQANDLRKIRAVVQALANGMLTKQAVGEATDLSERHVNYHLHAARILGWLSDQDEVTAAGHELLASPVASSMEHRLIVQAIESSPILERLVPHFLEGDPPSRSNLARHVRKEAGLAAATADRRAATLLAWRTQLQNPADRLFGGDWSDPPPSSGPAEGLALSTIEVTNFGLLRRVRANLGHISVCIGFNATGKSTLFDAVLFVTDALQHGPKEALERRAISFEDLLTFGKGSSFSFKFYFSIPPGLNSFWSRAVYALQLGRRPDGRAGVTDEQLYLEAKPAEDRVAEHGEPERTWVLRTLENRRVEYRSETDSWESTFHVQDRKLALEFLPGDEDRFPLSLRLRRFFETGVRRIMLSGDAMRRQRPSLAENLPSDGSGLPQMVRDLRRHQPEEFAEWLRAIRELLPDITGIREVEGDNSLYLKVSYGSYEVPSYRLSDGTLRILALTLLAYALEPEQLVLIEEPENGLHPLAVDQLFQILENSRCQMLLATHSPIFINVSSKKHLLIFSKKDGTSQITNGESEPALQYWTGNPSLGDLFAMKVLG